MLGNRHHWVIGGSLFVAVLLICGLYNPGLDGAFLLDDRHNIELNEGIKMEVLSLQAMAEAWGAGVTGGLNRPLSVLSFAFTHYLHGPDPRGYKLDNALIHIVNFFLVLLFFMQLLGIWGDKGKIPLASRRATVVFSLLTALIWAIHPLHISSVLYSVQRMTLLSGTFTLAALCSYLFWRQHLNRVGPLKFLMPLLITVLVVLGILSKENAVLFFGFILLIELFVFAGTVSSTREYWYRKIFWWAVVITLIVGLLYLHYQVFWFAEKYLMRDFNLLERLLTEARVVFHYMTWVLYPTLQNYGLFHDDITLSTSLLTPLTTLASIGGIVVLLAIAWQWRLSKPWFGFGIGFFLIGHSLEGTVVPLELVFEHRNYIPSLGLLLAVALMFLLVIETAKVRQRVYLVTIVAVITFLSAMTLLRSMEWSSYSRQIQASSERHPYSPRAQWVMGIWYLENHSQELAVGLDNADLYQQALHYAFKSAEADKHFVPPYFGLILFHYEQDRPFPPEWFAELKYRLEHSAYRLETDIYFEQLLVCYKHTECHVPEEDVKQLFNAALSSRSLMFSRKVNLLRGLSVFEYYRGNLPASVKALESALVMAPSAISYNNLVVLNLEMGDKQAAETSLQNLRSISDDPQSEEILQLEKLVTLCCEKPHDVE